MIVIRCEMWPKGDGTKAVEFARATIVNTLDTSLKTGGQEGDYIATFNGGVYGRDDLLNRVWKRSVVSGFNRRTRGMWDLLYLALKSAVGTRQ